MPHDGLRLHVQVAEHFVGPPSANEADDVGIDLGTQQGHGPCSTQRARTDVRWEEAELGGIKQMNPTAQSGGNLTGRDRVALAVHIVRSQDGGLVGPMPAQIEDSARHGFDGTERGITADTETNDLALDPIFLIGEGQSAKGGQGKVSLRAGGDGQSSPPGKQLYIGKSEGGCVRGASRVFSRPQQEEEREKNHVGDSQERLFTSSVSNMMEPPQNP
jgi:hypothetical protein